MIFTRPARLHKINNVQFPKVAHCCVIRPTQGHNGLPRGGCTKPIISFQCGFLVGPKEDLLGLQTLTRLEKPQPPKRMFFNGFISQSVRSGLGSPPPPADRPPAATSRRLAPEPGASGGPAGEEGLFRARRKSGTRRAVKVSLSPILGSVHRCSGGRHGLRHA
jgi:hypothetical protein